MIILTIIFCLLDIISKVIVDKSMNLFDNYVIIKDFFNISYVHNTGVAFSMFASNGIVLTIVSLIIILFIISYVVRNKVSNKYEILAFSMILGGALGNFINRLILGYVIDFLDFRIFGYNFPIFNLADTFIVIGIVIQLIVTWREKK